MIERDDSARLDREAILERRRRFVARAIAGIQRTGLTSPKTKLVALSISGLTTACPRPCLNETAGTNFPPDQSGSETEDTEASPPEETTTEESGSTS